MEKALWHTLLLLLAVAIFPFHLFRDYTETPQQAQAASIANDAGAKKPAAVVVELFTSQGCSSCPPAEAYMRELAKDANVLTLEYHVDYWDTATSWKDPFSSAEWTQRQVNYNHTLMKSDRVFTPQIVVDGRYQGVGSQKPFIQKFIREAQVQRGKPITITPHVLEGGKLLISINGGGADKDISVTLLRLLKREEAAVKSGENKSKKLTSYNIVTDINEVGRWSGGRNTYRVSMAPLKPHEGCAVLLQDPETMRILAGRFCGL